MNRAETIAYLGGLIDGDGYFKVTPNYRTPGTVHAYYEIVVGVQQLWPGRAVRLFASTFGGTVVEPQKLPSGRNIARCEVRGAKAASAARRLLPFLLLKRRDALLLREVERLRPHKRGRPLRNAAAYLEMATVREALICLHIGSWGSATPLPVPSYFHGYDELSPEGLGWSREQVLAYLAGVIDSDGNLRVEKRRAKGMISPHFRIGLRCAQVRPSAAVELLARTFGGRATTVRSTRRAHRDMVSWSLSDRSAVPALEALLPYLQVKWRQALLLLELRGLKGRRKEGVTEWRHRTRWQRVIPMRKRCYALGQIAEFERIYRAVRALHVE